MVGEFSELHQKSVTHALLKPVEDAAVIADPDLGDETWHPACYVVGVIRKEPKMTLEMVCQSLPRCLCLVAFWSVIWCFVFHSVL